MAIDHSAPILVVDDQEAMVQLVMQLVSMMGFRQVDQAPCGELALGMLRAQKYQLVISDLHMKPMDGLGLLQTIRGDESLKATRFLMITVDHTLPPVLMAKQSGANGYLLKPFTPQQLRDKVSGILSK